MIIYLITNKLNGKRYVGQTKFSIEDRFEKHVYDAIIANRGYALHAALRKYGIENFTIKLLSKCNNLGEANHRESYYIRLLNSLSPAGYNLRPGGDNSPISAETKKKMSENRKGNKHHFFGKHFSDQHKKNLSESQTGRGLGSKMSEETKKKMSLSHTGKEFSEDTKKKLSDALLGIPLTDERKENIRMAFWKSDSAQSRINRLIEEGLKTAKPVRCIETNMEYRSIHQAAKNMGLHRPGIKRSLDTGKKYRGYTFEYASEGNQQ